MLLKLHSRTFQAFVSSAHRSSRFYRKFLNGKLVRQFQMLLVCSATNALPYILIAKSLHATSLMLAVSFLLIDYANDKLRIGVFCAFKIKDRKKMMRTLNVAHDV